MSKKMTYAAAAAALVAGAIAGFIVQQRRLTKKELNA